MVVRGYHCPPMQQPYWNTIDLDKFDKDTLFQMIDEAYDEVLKHLPKKEQRRIPVNSSYKFVKTDGEDPAFVELCGKLDAALGNVIGVEKQKSLFDNLRKRMHRIYMIICQRRRLFATNHTMLLRMNRQ